MQITKRIFDFSLALVGLVLILPFLLIIASCIKITSPGPALFSQERVGMAGRIFRLYKFRTMIVGAESLGSSVTCGRDPKITQVGRILRKTKIDELPQLWNVLIGDMSLVGPRPDVPEIVKMYTPKMCRILEVRPGITSLASMQLRHEEELLDLTPNPDDAYLRCLVPIKVATAMKHATSPSLIFDLRVLVSTFWRLTAGRVFTSQEDELDATVRRAVLRYNCDRPDRAGKRILDSWFELPDAIRREIV